MDGYSRLFSEMGGWSCLLCQLPECLVLMLRSSLQTLFFRAPYSAFWTPKGPLAYEQKQVDLAKFYAIALGYTFLECFIFYSF